MSGSSPDVNPLSSSLSVDICDSLSSANYACWRLILSDDIPPVLSPPRLDDWDDSVSVSAKGGIDDGADDDEEL